MPLLIIEKDITKVRCDAIVNAANPSLLGGGGVDGAIHRAAGEQLLEECKTLYGCSVGDAKITKGYNLPCKYVIHTVGPVWHGGNYDEKFLLESCYKKSLELAKENGCDTIAFPLISSGAYGYPKARALSVAVETISKFLFDNEMTVYIAILDEASYEIDKELFNTVAEYIDDNYAEEYFPRDLFNHVKCSQNIHIPICYELDIEAHCADFIDEERLVCNSSETLEDMLAKMDDDFVVTLLKLIDKKGITEVTCYKKANVSKQTWYKIMNDKDYKPSKNTVIAFAIALELTLKETQSLLATVGFTLSNSSKFDVIIEYFLLKGVYDIFLINETLFKFDQVCLGV